MRAVPAIAIVLLLLSAPRAAEEWPAGEIPTRLADCDDLVREEPDRLESYRCYWFVGRNHDRLHEAARRLESLLQADRTNPHIQLTLGAVAADLGQERAEGFYREALEGYAGAGDARGEIYTRISLAMTLRQRGLTRESSEQLRRALARAEEVGDEALEVQVRVSLGWQKYYEREYGEAWRLFSEAERLLFPEGSIHEQLNTLDGLAAICWALERRSDALDYYRRMIELLKGNDPYRESGIRRNMAFVASTLAAEGRLDEAEATRLERDALDAAIRAGNPHAEVGLRLMLAESLPGREGLEHARTALAAARKMKRLADTSWALGFIAERSLRLDPRHPEPAFAMIEESIELAEGRGDRELLAKAMITRAKMRWTTGPRDRAIEEAFDGLDAIETIRDLQPDGEAKARVFGRFDSAYRDFAHALLGGNGHPSGSEDLERAFVILERMRARSLLDTLDAAGATAALAPSGPLSETRSGILNEIAAVSRKLRRVELMPGDRRRLRNRLSELESREASLRREIAQADPEFAALRGASIPSIEDLQGALRADQALIAFLVEENRGLDGSTGLPTSWAIVIGRGHVQAVRLADCRGLRGRVRLFLSLLDRKDGSERMGAERLFRELLRAPLSAAPDGVSRLVIIPDGPLHRLPFGALIDPGSDAFLAERYTVSIAPSAATWLRWKQTKGRVAASSLLALADPEIPPEFAAEDAHDSRSLGVGRALGPLPYARREAATLRRNLGSDGQVLVGAEASESALKSAEPVAFRVLHFASHAVVNDEHPGQSAVVLAADPSGEGEDGLLRFREVVGLDLDGQVVLLSACRGASGPLIGGEGVMGLANAFFQAGARTVVAGLWPVRDKETSLLIDRLGRHLSEGRSVATALTLARRDLVEKELPPAAWASMIVLGDGDHVPFPGGATRWRDWHPLAIAAVAVVALVILLSAFLRPAARP